MKRLTTIFSNTSQQGFSLIELAIVITIGGIIAIGLLTLGNIQFERTKIERTNARLDVIESALLSYVTQEGKLPCPAHLNAALNSSNYGIAEDCTAATIPANTGMISAGSGNEEVWIGAVPSRSLNLNDRFMVDGWNNRFSYAVVKAAASSNIHLYLTTATNGVITIGDWSDNQVTAATDNVVVGYVIISHGKDGGGSYSRVVTPSITSPTTPCAAGALDNENCNGDSIFRDIRINDSTVNADFFFDIIRWKPIHFLKELEVNP